MGVSFMASPTKVHEERVKAGKGRTILPGTHDRSAPGSIPSNFFLNVACVFTFLYPLPR
jgi:hypothetical protein